MTKKRILLLGHLLGALIILIALFRATLPPEMYVLAGAAVILLALAWLLGEIRLVVQKASTDVLICAKASTRLLRHSFMNDLQVISGWLQMDRPDRAKAYLSLARERITEESKAVNLSDPCLINLFLETFSYAAGSDIPIRLDVITSDFSGWPMDTIDFVLKRMLKVASREEGLDLKADEVSMELTVSCPGVVMPPLEARDLECQANALAKGKWACSVKASEGLIVTISKGKYRWWC